MDIIGRTSMLLQYQSSMSHKKHMKRQIHFTLLVVFGEHCIRNWVRLAATGLEGILGDYSKCAELTSQCCQELTISFEQMIVQFWNGQSFITIRSTFHCYTFKRNLPAEIGEKGICHFKNKSHSRTHNTRLQFFPLTEFVIKIIIAVHVSLSKYEKLQFHFLSGKTGNSKRSERRSSERSSLGARSKNSCVTCILNGSTKHIRGVFSSSSYVFSRDIATTEMKRRRQVCTKKWFCDCWQMGKQICGLVEISDEHSILFFIIITQVSTENWKIRKFFWLATRSNKFPVSDPALSSAISFYLDCQRKIFNPPPAANKKLDKKSFFKENAGSSFLSFWAKIYVLQYHKKLFNQDS